MQNLCSAQLEAAERLAEAARNSTVSYEDPTRTDKVTFLRLRALLKKLYPVVHERLQRQVVTI